MFNFSLTRDDYQYYVENREKFNMSYYEEFINEQGPRHNVIVKETKHINNLDALRKEMVQFYECGFKRDNAFMKNIRFQQVEGNDNVNNKDVTVLVTGGFHTENLCELFKDAGISYVTIVPAFKSPEGYQSPYFGVLGGTANTSVERSIGDFIFSMIAIQSFVNRHISDATPTGERRRMVLDLYVKWNENRIRHSEGQLSKQGIVFLQGTDYIVVDWDGKVVSEGQEIRVKLGDLKKKIQNNKNERLFKDRGGKIPRKDRSYK